MQTLRQVGRLKTVVRDSTEIKTGARHILNGKIEPEFKSPRFRKEMKVQPVPLSYHKNAAMSRQTNRINSDYFPSDMTAAMRVTSTPNPTQIQMSSYIRNKNEAASIHGLSARRNISKEYRQVLKDKSDAHKLKQQAIEAQIQQKKDENEQQHAQDLEKRGYDPGYLMGRTGPGFSHSKFATMTAQGCRETLNRTTLGFEASYRLSSAGQERTEALTLQDMDSQFNASTVRSRRMSPARIKFNLLSTERCVSPRSLATAKIQAECIKNASKFQLWNMPKELKMKSLQNLELLQMNQWEKNRLFMSKLSDDKPKLKQGLNEGNQKIPAYMVFQKQDPENCYLRDDLKAIKASQFQENYLKEL